MVLDMGVLRLLYTQYLTQLVGSGNGSPSCWIYYNVGVDKYYLSSLIMHITFVVDDDQRNVSKFSYVGLLFCFYIIFFTMRENIIAFLSLKA